MLTVLTWKWGYKFGPHYVNRLRAMLERNLTVEHELVCVTDNTYGLDHRVRVVVMPERYRYTARCRRRMQHYSIEFAQAIGATRILAIDLDVVIVGDLTPIVDRSEPLVLWRVEYAKVFSGAFQLFNAGVLNSLWQMFERDPNGLPLRAWPRGIGSDQAMLNYYLRGAKVPHWTGADGFVTYFGIGYERFAHYGVSPSQPVLPEGARIVVFGSDDIDAMETGAFDWVREHWRE